MAKGKNAADFSEAMNLLQVSSPELPANADMSATPKTTEIPQAPPAVTTLPVEKTEIQPTETELSTEVPEEKSAEEEQKRRTWQGEADRAKKEAERLAAEKEAGVAELKLERERNQMLMQMLAGTSAIKGRSEPPPQKAVATDKEPQLWDFIPKDEYDKDDVADPSTSSGQAYHRWLDARAEWKAEKTYQSRRKAENEAQATELTLKKARQLAETYPEFRNVFTMEPDLARIQAWLDKLGQMDWVALKQALDGKLQKAGEPNGAPVIISPPTSEAEIARRASKPASLTGQSAVSPTPKKLPVVAQELYNLFGGNIVLPADME